MEVAVSRGKANFIAKSWLRFTLHPRGRQLAAFWACLQVSFFLRAFSHAIFPRLFFLPAFCRLSFLFRGTPFFPSPAPKLQRFLSSDRSRCGRRSAPCSHSRT